VSEVLVTGATGYIARHVVVQLLDAGHTVRGTTRSAGAIDALRSDLAPFLMDADSLDRFSVVSADLTADNGWDDAVRGCTHVQHLASPIPGGPPKHEDELIIPARDGTLRVLRAALAGGVERVVVTSSVAAVIFGGDRHGRRFTAADWSDLNGKRIGVYEKSKTLAERAARDFMRDEAAGRMEMVTINPGAVLGPMYGNAFSTSNELVKKLMDRAYPATPDVHFSIVDVRDVAAAHVAAMTAPGIDGGRYLIGIEDHSMREMARVLADHYGPLGYKIPTANLPNWVLHTAAKFDKVAALALNDLANPVDLDAGPVIELLGRPLRQMPETTIAMADSLIEYGLVKQKPKLRHR
jgi:dihydroflavonol-4-reductase